MRINKIFFCFLACFISISQLKAQFKETMNLNGYRVNLVKDYGLKNDNALTPQGVLVQKAVNDVAKKKNGGIVYIPKGVYNITGVTLKSNVHVLIAAGTVLKVVKESLGPKGVKKTKKKVKRVKDKTKGVVFAFDVEGTGGKGKNKKDKESSEYIENVSVRGDGGSFVIDYHHLKSSDRQRAFTLKMVRNFLIENVDVKDNYTVYCGISFSPSSSKKDVSKWKVSRPTDGLIRNYRHFRGSPGYGAIQCHGGQTVHFENIYTHGGVAFRLEVGANNKHVGVFDMSAKNIICEEGKIAAMFGPHSAKNGIVTIDGILAIGCVAAFTMGDGHVKKDAPDQTPGWFDSRSSVKNIHAIYGLNAQIKGTNLGSYRDPKFLEQLKIWSDGKFFSGPSLKVVSTQPKKYKVTLQNISWSGFPFNPTTPLPEPANRHETKKQWSKTHVGKQWETDKGVTNKDYKVESVKAMNARIKKLVAKTKVASHNYEFKY